jgi:molecular chaperone GrpE
MDDLERAIETGKKSKDLKALLEGVRMVYKNLQSMLEKEGVEKIDAVGKPFDPLAHEILVKIPTKDHEEGTVIEETRKGFTFKGKVIRPSIVKVACKKNEEGEQS